MDDSPDAGGGRPELEQSVRGMKFGRYTLAGEIGRGGMGIVYRARQDRLGREVALKVLPGSAMMTEEWERRFKLEAESIARLYHPHVVKVIEAGEHRGQLFIVMELICGDNLATRLQDGPLEATMAAQFMHQIADAVAHTHAHDVLHRDLKPSNILIDDTGQAMLVDFGLARPLSGPEAMTQLVIGSPHYMPPERLDAHSSTVAEAVSGDIYGLGSVLYHCLTGIPPHSGESVAAILASMAEREPVAPRLLRPRFGLEVHADGGVEQQIGALQEMPADARADFITQIYFANLVVAQAAQRVGERARGEISGGLDPAVHPVLIGAAARLAVFGAVFE